MTTAACSNLGRTWISSFHPPGVQQFWDVCTSVNLCCCSSSLYNLFSMNKEGLFLGTYEGCAVKAVICSFRISFMFIAWSSSLPLQEIGRAVGIALRKQFGWQADLRAPDLEVGHLSAGWPVASSRIGPRVLYFFLCSLCLQYHSFLPFVFLLLSLTRNHLVVLSRVFQWHMYTPCRAL